LRNSQDPHPIEPEDINRFAFLVHPLDIGFIHRHPDYRWSKHLPGALVEWIAAWFPPIYLSRITGGRSPQTGQRIEGYLYSLGLTPRQMMMRSPEFTYQRIDRAVKMAARRGAKIMGLGAFTSVIGDAGITVARRSPIAITSGNSLTAAITLETARIALNKMGWGDLRSVKAMVVGATGSIGSICSRLLASQQAQIICVSPEAQKLHALQQKILQESPYARLSLTTDADAQLGECELIITAATAIGQKVFDIRSCKMDAVICDVARPPNITQEEAAQRPDVLVIESGETVIPGDVDFGYDLDLPPGVTYACLAETALLAMEGRFESFSLGRDISMDKATEILELFRKHHFKVASLRTFGMEVSDAEIAEKRRYRDQLQ
jgi:predicted amino acid dehydrogenase